MLAYQRAGGGHFGRHCGRVDANVRYLGLGWELEEKASELRRDGGVAPVTALGWMVLATPRG